MHCSRIGCQLNNITIITRRKATMAIIIIIIIIIIIYYYLLLSLLLFFCRIYEQKCILENLMWTCNGHFLQYWVKIIAGFHTDFKGTLTMNM